MGKKPSVFDIESDKPREVLLAQSLGQIRRTVNQHLKDRIKAGYDEGCIDALKDKFDSWMDELKNTPRDPAA